MREGGRRDADRFGDRGGKRGASPGDTQCPVVLAGTDGSADHRRHWRAEPEDQRHQQVLEPHRRAIASDGGGADQASKPGGGMMLRFVDSVVTEDAAPTRRISRSGPHARRGGRGDGLSTPRPDQMNQAKKTLPTT